VVEADKNSHHTTLLSFAAGRKRVQKYRRQAALVMAASAVSIYPKDTFLRAEKQTGTSAPESPAPIFT
jgi:hypothetical protein